MARQRFPLTPGSSSDIKGKDGVKELSSPQLSFELPPPAIHDASGATPLQSFPMQAAEAVKARRRSSAAREPKDSTFALPPPPTRSRKIIQMKPAKPRNQDETGENQASKDAPKAGGKASSTAKSASGTAGSGAGAQAKKKQPTATSAAGRKIARKTAHSLIERRRRSKMNEEFAVLKNMIPACSGDMHKLAILQASIDYVRYLEDCVSKLKAQHEHYNSQGESSHRPLPPIRQFHPTFHEDPALDVDMSDSEEASPTRTTHPDQSERFQQAASVSPAMLPQDSRNRQESYSSVSTDYRQYSYCHSAGASPAFGPQTYGDPSGSCSTLTSPGLQPQSELDHEATAALLMLNTDRRGTQGSGRGLSVRDLLSS